MECVIRPSGEAPAKDFLEKDLERISEKGKDEPQATARAHFMALFDRMASYGDRLMGKRFKKEMGVLYAFKSEVKNLQIRFPCFRDGNKWILTHGFIKPGGKKGLGTWPKTEVDRAEKIMNEYLQAKEKAEDKKGGGR